MSERLTVTARTTPHRFANRMRTERATLWQLLDEALYCHVAFVVDAMPRVLPTIHVRVGDTLYLHGSTGSGPMLAARSGLNVCIAVTLIDALAFARSQFHHSANYRSAIVHGRAALVTDPTVKRTALAALVDHLATGRSAHSRPPTDKELAQTAVLAVPLDQASVKVRADGINEEAHDMDLPHWAGVLPLRLGAGTPEPDDPTRPLPEYLIDWHRGERPARSAWLEPAPMSGRYVRLEPLRLHHVDDLYEAGRDPQVWQWLNTRAPADRDELAAQVVTALREHARGLRVPWAQVEVATGRAIGTTSYHDVWPDHRRLEIGHTWLGVPWWRGPYNTEAKLLLLERAFEVLGAVCVGWRADALNERSVRAIERLGASRDGVLRNHLRRPDGTQRDSVVYSMTHVEWPAAGRRLAGRL